MLKWTVNNRRLSVAKDYATSCSDVHNGDGIRQRQLSDGTLTPLPKHYGQGGVGRPTMGSESCSAIAKRRRSEVIRRRSATINNQWKNRHSLCLDFPQDLDKENDTGGCSTSTPIKSFCTGSLAAGNLAALEAFRDVSNLTPTIAVERPRVAATPTGRRSSLLSLKKCRSDSKVQSQLKKKGKKQCVDSGRHHRELPLFGNSASKDCTNYFRTFEAVDSHITSKYVDGDMCCIVDKNKTTNANPNYASTLPSLAMECDSPLGVLNTQSQLRNLLVDKGDGDPPKKRLKFDHVNDFLQQISFPSTSNLKVKNSIFPGFQISKLNNNETFFGGARVSPLVNKLINLKFSNNNDSSIINDLSLDKIVTAILDTSSKNSEDCTNASVVVQFEQENEINETLEENIINAANEQLIRSVSSKDKNSSKSGFKSATTEINQKVNEIDFNVHCQCSRKNNSHNDKTYINIEETFNERCVDTSQEDFTLKRRRCVRRKRTYDDNLNENTYVITPKRQTSREFLQSERFSPGSKCSPYNDDSYDSSYDRQVTLRILEPQSNKRRTRRCLLFESPEGTSSDVEGRPNDIGSLRNNCNELFNLGYMDLNIQYENGIINLYVHRCYNLPLIHGFPVNAYVKVILTQRPTGASNSVSTPAVLRKQKQQLQLQNNPQRTAVQSESRSPAFHHAFQLAATSVEAAAAPSPHNGLIAAETTSGMVLLIEVWHRDRINRRSDFIGCMSFDIPHAIETAIHGSYHLLPQSCGRYYNVCLSSDVSSSPYTSAFTFRPWNADPSRNSNIINNKSIGGPTKPLQLQNIIAPQRPTTKRKPTGNMCESQSSVEEGFGYDDIDNELLKNMTGSSNSTKAALSQYQRDADENLFLRYLELDPTEGPEAIPAATQRKAIGARNSGRTPFTSTRVIARPPKSGYGFSVVWTNPPRIERVEKGLPAERAGIIPGDYIIFVDKQNVVMMPEIDILNLIRSCGNQLTLEIYCKPTTRNGSASINNTGISTFSTAPPSRDLPSRQSSTLAAITVPACLVGLPPGISIPTAPGSTITTITQRRPSTVCSTNTVSVDYTASQSRRTDVGGAGVGGGGHSSASGVRMRRPLPLPHVVTFNTEKYSNADDARRKAMYQLIHKEQQYVTALQFAISRFVTALQDRKDLITQAEHKILFQNSEEILRLSEGIIGHLIHEDGDYHTQNLLRVYHCKLSEIGSVYKRYCAGIKKADCVLANKTKNSNSQFVEFLQNPAIPRRRPDITVFIHKPLQHFREVLKLFHVMLSNTKSNYEDYPVISQIVHGLQSIYREITTEAGIMEPVGEGKPLLSVQDLENRLVFTKCKPFILSKPGRQWIFGGDLSRIEGRNVRQYWTLLFSDILLFAKVSRDRVLFILEDPLPLTNISELCFNVRKKATEFRILTEPNACKAVSSPTVHCGPDLSRTPRKNPAKKCIVLRAPTIELKAVWQNLLQRQIYHINALGDSGGGAGTGACDGSSFNSTPLDSPLGVDDTLCTDRCDVPLSMNAAMLQHSAESLSTGAAVTAAAAAASVPPVGRRQTPRYLNGFDKADSKTQINELIEHKCKQLGRSSSSSKGSVIHLERWMKGEIDGETSDVQDEESDLETWSEDMVRKRSQELHLIDHQGNCTNSNTCEFKKCESRFDEVTLSDHELSPSKSTTTESQVTVRSSPVVPESINVCRQCHKNCLTNTGIKSNQMITTNNNVINVNPNKCSKKAITNQNHACFTTKNDEFDGDANNDSKDQWHPLMLMGLSALNPAATLMNLDPFAAPVPVISVLPPTPEPKLHRSSNMDFSLKTNFNNSCSCQNERVKIPVEDLILDKNYECSPDDSPVNAEQPYHSLSSSNLTLRRFGTVSSLERVGSDEREETFDTRDFSDDSEEILEEPNKELPNDETTSGGWRAKAGSFVAAKMAFLEKLGEDYRVSSKFFDRYIKTTEITVNGEDVQEEETSGATSDEIWGTPTSGGELEELSSPNYDARHSPPEGSISSNGDDTELMMDELLMTPPISSASIRGLLPRRTLEPLMEEEYSDSYSSTSTNASSPTEPSLSPEQGNGTGDAADACFGAVEGPEHIIRRSLDELDMGAADLASHCTSQQPPKIHRSDSYQQIIEAENNCVTFFNRFKSRPSMKFVNIERIPRARGIKLLEFFNKRRERKIYETYPLGKPPMKDFRGDDYDDDDSSYSCSERSISLRKIDKQLDRRFWKQLSKRRSQNKQHSQ